VPFIIIGNIILVFVFDRFKKDFWKGVILSSFSKFLFLYLSSFVISEILFPEKMARIATTMMGYPQLVTALLGGLIAYFVLSFNTKKNS
jgi:riboflavin transporter